MPCLKLNLSNVIGLRQVRIQTLFSTARNRALSASDQFVRWEVELPLHFFESMQATAAVQGTTTERNIDPVNG